jgi:hypothetical protein
VVVIRAHFDGSVIVPDEPVTLPPQSKVVVLVDSAGPPSGGDLEEATRQYYQGRSPDEVDDDGWGQGLASDSRRAWDQK